MVQTTYWNFQAQFLLIFFTSLFQNSLQNSLIKYQIPNVRTNWFKANEFCNSIGMQLVTIRSRAENDAVAKFVQGTDKFNDVGCSFWIGGSDLSEEGTFSWMATGQLVTFTNWSSGEPNNANETEDCMQLVYIPRFEQRWTWNDNQCKQNNMYFICESGKIDCVDLF